MRHRGKLWKKKALEPHIDIPLNNTGYHGIYVFETYRKNGCNYVTAESLNIIPQKPLSLNRDDSFFDMFKGMGPTPELLGAFGLLLPRLMRQKIVFDEELVPEDSAIRRAVIESRPKDEK